MHVHAKWFQSKVISAAFVVAAFMAYRPVLANYTLNTVASFNGANGNGPVGNLTLSSGKFFGVTTFGSTGNLGSIFGLSVGSNVITTVASFIKTNGSYPQFGLTTGADGNLYGTTAGGGPSDYGTIYRLVPGSSALNTLATFDSGSGRYPYSSLIFGVTGNFYGTTTAGGTNTSGTLFKVDAETNALSTVVTFNTINGSDPQGGLTVDAKGNFYSTTVGSWYGTVFKLAAGTNTLTTLATFNNINGPYPQSNLTIDADGNLYGTTNRGGTNGLGTVFKIADGTNVLTTLVSFDRINGALPQAGLALDTQGNLFGTTAAGGLNNLGTVFEVNPIDNSLTTLAAFNGSNGSTPSGGLYVDAGGNIFGTTNSGGNNNRGTIFELSIPEPTSLSLVFMMSATLLHRITRIRSFEPLLPPAV